MREHREYIRHDHVEHRHFIPENSQSMPSMICCIPNNSGIIANGISALCRTFFSVSTPITDNAVPATKLAVAEKHISVLRASSHGVVFFVAVDQFFRHWNIGQDPTQRQPDFPPTQNNRFSRYTQRSRQSRHRARPC